MPPRTWFARFLAAASLLALAGCADWCNDNGGGDDPPPTPAPTSSVTPATTPVAVCGECGPSTNTESMPAQSYDPRIYYHLAEGSELFPLVWLKAMHDFSTGSDTGPFLDNVERFGLLPDPDATCQIPVGLTGLHSGDPRFMGVRMTGLTCAACHVGEVTHGEQTVRIPGGPNLFDTVKFLQDAGMSAKHTATHIVELFRFIGRALQVDCGPGSDAQVFNLGPADVASPQMVEFTEEFYAAYPSFEALQEGGEFERALAGHMEAVWRTAMDDKSPDLRDWTDVSREGAYSDYRRRWQQLAAEPYGRDFVTPEMLANREEFRRAWLGQPQLMELPDFEPAEQNPFSELEGEELADTYTSFLTDFWRTLRLLKARVVFLQRLAAQDADPDDPSTWAGYGRVDAFGSSRINLFAKQIALKAPVNYPHLWGLGKQPWYHWDGNSDALRERNVGQALALGAVYDADTGDSTVLFGNLRTLEAMSRDLAAPPWPFDAVDETLADKGAEIYDETCAGCHPKLTTDEQAPLNRVALADVGTDPERATSFAAPLDGECFPEKLQAVLEKIMEAGGEPEENAVWCAPEKYVSWPLDGVWATAPYLHNGSVRSIRELLRAPDGRAQTFFVGSREYAPDELGYQNVEDPVRPMELDTSETGNANTGHVYGTELGDSEKDALIEFLKTL